MELYKVGRKIKEERIRKKISQEELCYGLCSVSTLSRIENDTQKPTLKIEEALLEKLGCSTENLVFYASEEEIEKHNLETELTVLTMHRQPLGDKLAEYKRLIENKNGSHMEKQFALMSEAIGALYSGNWELSRVLAQLEEALLLTMPDYEERELITIKLLTLTEIIILNNIAIVLHKQKNIGKAVKIMNFLVEYLEKRDLSTDTMGKKYPMLLYNLIKMEVEYADGEELLKLCERGISFGKKYARLAYLAEFFYYKAVACQELNRQEEAKESYEHAICLCKITERRQLAMQIQQEYAELFKCNYSHNQNQ
ncbi:MAG: helix-turn-helix domain-containing protein [Lachnospiraceae bacterium]